MCNPLEEERVETRSLFGSCFFFKLKERKKQDTLGGGLQSGLGRGTHV
jgi:hypothetical protein